MNNNTLLNYFIYELDISNDIKKEIQDSNAELKTPLYDGDYLLYFSENKDILLNDQTNFKNFYLKSLILAYFECPIMEKSKILIKK